MNSTVFLTIFTGFLTYVLGQIVLKLLIEPVQEMKKTIAQISHAMIEHANVIQNPGVPTDEVMKSVSQKLRSLSSQLHAQLRLVPMYRVSSRVFFLPSQDAVLEASKSLIGLSNSVFKATDKIYEHNAKRVEKICDSLGIFMAKDDRWPTDQQ